MVEIRIGEYKADLGYVLARSYWGHGFMPEAVGAVVAALRTRRRREFWRRLGCRRKGYCGAGSAIRMSVTSLVIVSAILKPGSRD